LNGFEEELECMGGYGCNLLGARIRLN